ncbi:MAG: cobalamin-dependent protein, partial [Candidatus Cloacimonadaceae bacterium]
MKKILFAALNSSWSQSNLAFYYLREMVRDLDFESVLKSYTLKEPLMQVMNDIYLQQAEIICFSAYIWNRLYLQDLHRELGKILRDAIFVIGGPEAGHFKNIRNTIVIEGAGEAAFRELALKGFSLQAGAQFRSDPLPLNKVPFPYREEDKADLADHLVYYECYRGCPYHCAY